MTAPLINDSDLTKGRPPMTTSRTVQGFCPYGHGKTLELCDDGRIRCSDPGCERPYAASDILADPETDHVVWFEAKGYWTTKHPLRERLGDLAGCALGDYLATLDRDPVPPGEYRAILVGDSWTWGTPIGQPGPDTAPVPSDAGAGFLAAPEDIPVVIPGGC